MQLGHTFAHRDCAKKDIPHIFDIVLVDEIAAELSVGGWINLEFLILLKTPSAFRPRARCPS
jgi:hypothetical protein